MLSGTLVVFSMLGLLLETAYSNNSRAEEILCRMDVCATGRLIDSIHAHQLEAGKIAAVEGLRESREALRRDPAAADRWCDLAESLAISGSNDAARAFRRAVELAPNSPPVLLEAANYYFRAGEPKAALPLTARILGLIRDYDGVIFLAYSRSGLPVREVVRLGLPEDAEAARAYCENCLRGSMAAEDVGVVWEYVVGRRCDTPALRAKYVDFMLSRGLYDAAVRFWGYPRGNLVFNGGFEAPFSGAKLDWLASHAPHVSEQRESGAGAEGGHALRVDFDGAANIEYHGVSQSVIVSPGRYHFGARVKLSHITTDRGPFFRIYDPASPARLDVRTAELTGTMGWSPVDLEFSVPAGARVLVIQLCRTPSLKFDSHIAGTLWVDLVQVTSRK